MCSVLGFLVTDPEAFKENFEKVYKFTKNLYRASSVRGKASTGAMVFSDRFMVVKKAVSPKKFVEGEKSPLSWVLKPSIKVFVGHTRWPSLECATVSDRNAHPFVGHNYALVHNGYLPDWPQIKEQWVSLKKKHLEVDSEVILTFLERTGDLSFLIDKIPNTVYSLVIMRKSDGRVFFVRKGNPMVFLSLKKHGIFIWASTTSILQMALRMSYKNIPWDDLPITTIPENFVFTRRDGRFAGWSMHSELSGL